MLPIIILIILSYLGWVMKQTFRYSKIMEDLCKDPELKATKFGGIMFYCTLPLPYVPSIYYPSAVVNLQNNEIQNIM